MADAVVNTTLRENPQLITKHLTNISDASGESAVIKIDKSAIMVAGDGAEPAALDLVEIRWAVQGFTSVRLLWDHDTDDVCFVMSGNGYENFARIGGAGVKADPLSTGGTGDVLLTTAGAASGATYDITATFKKRS